jgi:hypothetical protein
MKLNLNPNIHYESNFLARYFSEILGYRGRYVWEVENQQFTLDVSNNWRLKKMFPNCYELHYRYEGSHQKEMDALKTTIIWRLGLENFN